MLQCPNFKFNTPGEIKKTITSTHGETLKDYAYHSVEILFIVTCAMRHQKHRYKLGYQAQYLWITIFRPVLKLAMCQPLHILSNNHACSVSALKKIHQRSRLLTEIQHTSGWTKPRSKLNSAYTHQPSCLQRNS